MPATRDGKLWRSQFYYKDWQGVRRKKNKRGFKTKGEADEWERNFLQQQQKNLDISFENFVEIYFADMENRLRESTIINKRYVFDLKVTPYFKHKEMCEIQTSDIRAWQNELIKKGYAPTYLKSINNQLAALFNYAVRYYDLRDNPCKKAGSIGKSKADEMDFWTKQEFKEFLPSMDSKPEANAICSGNIVIVLAFKFAIFPRGGDIHGIQFSCDLGCGVAFRRPLKYHLHIWGNILVRFHTSVCTLAIAVRTDDTLIFPTTHLCVFCTFGFHGHISAITLANKILESNINPSGITFEISCVKIITDGNKTGVVKRKYPLNKIARFNAVTSKSGKVFYNNTVDLSGLNHC